MKVGFVGLGTMGLPMARCLLRAGHELSCYSRSHGPAGELESAGAAYGMNCARDVVEYAEVTFLCLPDDTAVTSVVRDCLPVAGGKVIVDCSTVAPATEVALDREVTAAGGFYMDAPVSGGPTGAQQGTLAVMAGGDPLVFERASEPFSAFAKSVQLVGPIGAGQVIKACNQMIVGAQLAAIAECCALVQRAGLDPRHLHHALVHSTADCVMARTRFPVPGVVDTSPASNAWRPDFTTRLMAKDLRIATEITQAHGVQLSSLPVILGFLESSETAGNGTKDWSAFAELLMPPDSELHRCAQA